MAIDVTPLGYQKPDGMTELVKRGAEMISENAQLSQDLISSLIDAGRNHIDGGSPETLYEVEQTFDGGTV